MQLRRRRYTVVGGLYRNLDAPCPVEIKNEELSGQAAPQGDP